MHAKLRMQNSSDIADEEGTGLPSANSNHLFATTLDGLLVDLYLTVLKI